MADDRHRRDGSEGSGDPGAPSRSSGKGKRRLLARIPFSIPIPPVLHSFLHEGLFERCLMCEKFLLEDGTPYVIEKAIRGDEPIFEYAICAKCYAQVSDELSRESTIRVHDHFVRQGVDLVKRRRDLAQRASDSIEPWIDRCVVTGVPRRECTEYQIYAECVGRNLKLAYAPFLIGGHALAGIVELLSPQTRDRLNDFIEEYLGLPPELKALTKDRGLVVL